MCAKILLTVKKRRKVKKVSEIWALYGTSGNVVFYIRRYWVEHRFVLRDEKTNYSYLQNRIVLKRRNSDAVAAQRLCILKFTFFLAPWWSVSLADFLSSFFSRIFIIRALLPLAYKKQTLPQVGWWKKYLSVNCCDFLTPTDAITENLHMNIWPLRNITNPTGWVNVKMG